ncbi:MULTISPECIES: hypothetical protein [unclassified Stenotrophomonas]|uniref:hypothetical protein n=1 Tax=unclassified Stenotrophomonas TaxID=196198 RepID=UPI00209C34A7|nr:MULTISPECIES: hypothetical protein [unclassified Stenotrophomonas]
MKKVLCVAGTVAIFWCTAEQALAGSDLLRHIGRAIQGTPKVVSERSRSPYLEPPGTYWDLDQEGLEGVQHLRAGVTAVGGGGVDTCDMQLLAMAHSAYRIEADKRQWCLRQWWLMDTKVHGANDISGNDPAAIERRYGPAFDARLERFKGIRRFGIRPTFQALGDVAYRADRGVLEGFIPMPQVSAAGQSVTGKGFVPWVHRTSTGGASPPNAGRFHLLGLPLGTAPSRAARQPKGRDPGGARQQLPQPRLGRGHGHLQARAPFLGPEGRAGAAGLPTLR